MHFLVVILSIVVFIKTASYGIYELRENNNKSGGIVVISIAFLSLILPNVVIHIRGI